MAKRKAEAPKVELQEKSYCIALLEESLEDVLTDIARARTNQRRRVLKAHYNFFGSIVHHLKE